MNYWLNNRRRMSVNRKRKTEWVQQVSTSRLPFQPLVFRFRCILSLIHTEKIHKVIRICKKVKIYIILS